VSPRPEGAARGEDARRGDRGPGARRGRPGRRSHGGVEGECGGREEAACRRVWREAGPFEAHPRQGQLEPGRVGPDRAAPTLGGARGGGAFPRALLEGWRVWPEPRLELRGIAFHFDLPQRSRGALRPPGEGRRIPPLDEEREVPTERGLLEAGETPLDRRTVGPLSRPVLDVEPEPRGGRRQVGGANAPAEGAPTATRGNGDPESERARSGWSGAHDGDELEVRLPQRDDPVRRPPVRMVTAFVRVETVLQGHEARRGLEPRHRQQYMVDP